MLLNFKRITRIGLVVAFVFHLTSAHAYDDEVYEELKSFVRIIELVNKNYADKVDNQKLIQGAIKGMLESLDPHTVYLDNQAYQEFQSDTEGKFSGIGIEVTIRDGILTIVTPIEDSPAAKAGLLAGDRILKIDGQTTKGFSLQDAVSVMRGPRKKPVVLSIWREGLASPLEYRVVRDIINIKNVSFVWYEEPKIAYFKITQFQEGTTNTLKTKLDELRKQKREIKAILIDLRNNPGGLLDEAAKLSDLFLAKGTIVSIKGRVQEEEKSIARKNSPYEKMPLAVLINQGSASAAEIFAGAIQDLRRGKILGEKSFGKGSVQTIIELADKTALKITIAHYYTPKGTSIDGKGIMPDIVLDKEFLLEWKKDQKPPQKEEHEFFRKLTLDYAIEYLSRGL